MNSNSTGARFEILVDGKSRSWRDVQETAIEAARYLKEKHPHSDVAVRDARNGATVSVMMTPHASRHAAMILSHTSGTTKGVPCSYLTYSDWLVFS
jgi:hypothetical protein